jgi:D-glycero-alpha-D-manno-heptose-7-phosphate kinase
VLIARSPLRISFGGGGTDLAAYYEQFGGMVVSATINKYIYAIVNKNFDTTFQVMSSDYRSSILQVPIADEPMNPVGPEMQLCHAIHDHFQVRLPVNVFVASEVPPGTGLGSSSTLAVTLCNVLSTLNDRPLSRAELAETAYHIETQRLEAPIGKQDQYAAAFGGLNCIEFTKDGVSVTPLKMDLASIRTLEQHLMLFFTGSTRQARDILHEQQKSSQQNSGRTVDSLHRIKELGWQMKEALEAGQLELFGKLLDISWQHKKQLAQGISNPTIDKAYDLAIQHGALGGKIAGAGGGGFLLLYCPLPYQKEVRSQLETLGLGHMPSAFDFEGSRIILHTGQFNQNSTRGLVL